MFSICHDLITLEPHTDSIQNASEVHYPALNIICYHFHHDVVMIQKTWHPLLLCWPSLPPFLFSSSRTDVRYQHASRQPTIQASSS